MVNTTLPESYKSLIVYKKQLMQSHSPFKIIENSEIETDTVGFGNKIVIQRRRQGQARRLLFVRSLSNLILTSYPMVVTYHSPFGQAIIGKKVGESFTLDIRGEKIKFTITSIKKLSED